MKTLIRFVLLIVIVVALAGGGMVWLAHNDTTARIGADYQELAPVSATFSRFRCNQTHLISIYWRLHYSGKVSPMPAAVASWSLRPFRHVALAR